VRDAADGAARAIMGQLSGQGVKLVLPALLKGVEDKAWRTKQGSIQVRWGAWLSLVFFSIERKSPTVQLSCSAQLSAAMHKMAVLRAVQVLFAPLEQGQHCFCAPRIPLASHGWPCRTHQNFTFGHLRGSKIKPCLPLSALPVTPPLPQLLGAMAHCAPKQLGSCLPVVVPRLGEVLADPHPKVAAAARTALNEVGGWVGWWMPGFEVVSGPAGVLPAVQGTACMHACMPFRGINLEIERYPNLIVFECLPQVGSVIRNPEVAKLVPVLLAGGWAAG